MVAALRERGLEVEVATTDADGGERRLTKADLPPGADGVHLFRYAGGETLKYSRDLGRWLASHARDYDVIQTHSNWNYPVAAACLAARRTGVPYVIRPCGMLSKYSLGRSKWKKRAYWWLRERRNVHHAAGFHVTSEGERREVMGLGVSARVDVIPLGIGADAWQAPTEPNWLRDQCPQAGDRPIVLFLSRLHPKKGITDLLLPALARLNRDAFLAIVGGDDGHSPGYSQRVEAEIERLGLTKKAALLGPIPPHNRWAAFDGADVFVLPSHAENFGIVVPEAMARAKPVVVTPGVQFADHVQLSGGGTVVAADAQELAAAMDAWLCDEAARSRAGALAKEYVRKHFSWRQTAEKLVGLYHDVCTRHQCSRP
jgi:glycosyltransferase involved in cell wall biosynthesis